MYSLDPSTPPCKYTPHLWVTRLTIRRTNKRAVSVMTLFGSCIDKIFINRNPFYCKRIHSIEICSNESNVHLTVVTVCSSVPVLTTRTHSDDMITRFIVYTMSITSFSAIHSKISYEHTECDTYLKEKWAVSHTRCLHIT